MRNNKRHIIILIATICLGGFLALNQVMAADETTDITYTPEVKLPGVFDKTVTVGNDMIGNYFKALYVYFIWAVGAIAVTMIVFGGVKWVAAAGNAARINDARDTINSAIIGIIVALTSVVLLNLISPQFTIFKLPDLNKIKTNYFSGVMTIYLCAPSSDIKCGEIMKEGTTTDFNGKTVDAYCLGTICSDKEVCSIQKVEKLSRTIYTPLNGCINKIPIEPTDDNYKVTELSIQNYKDICGEIGLFLYVGNNCTNTSKQACYLDGPKGQVVTSTDNDYIKNMACPGDWR